MIACVISFGMGGTLAFYVDGAAVAMLQILVNNWTTMMWSMCAAAFTYWIGRAIIISICVGLRDAAITMRTNYETTGKLHFWK